jgi:hypothetical protein
VAVTVVLAACGSGGSSDAGSSSTTSTTITSAAITSTTITPTATTSTTGEQASAFIDIETCDNSSGEGTASGTIENQGSTATAYHLQLGFYDSDSNVLLATASLDTTSVEPGEATDWKVSVSGLGNADVVCHTVKPETGTGGPGPTTSTTSAAAQLEFPCNLVSQAEIDQITGNPLDPGDAQTNHVTEDDASWTERECAWLKLGVETATEVRLGVSRAADFPSGSVGCPPLASSTAVSGVGDQAQWSWNDPGTTVTVGALRVCTGAVLLQVTVTGTTSGDHHLEIARSVAQSALAAI